MKAKDSKKNGSAPDTPEAELKKSIGTMDRILIFLGVFVFLFIVTMIVLFILYQQTPDVLIGAVIAAAIGEAGVMGSIQRNKEKAKQELRERQEQGSRDPESEGTQ